MRRGHPAADGLARWGRAIHGLRRLFHAPRASCRAMPGPKNPLQPEWWQPVLSFSAAPRRSMREPAASHFASQSSGLLRAAPPGSDSPVPPPRTWSPWPSLRGTRSNRSASGLPAGARRRIGWACIRDRRRAAAVGEKGDARAGGELTRPGKTRRGAGTSTACSPRVWTFETTVRPFACGAFRASRASRRRARGRCPPQRGRSRGQLRRSRWGHNLRARRRSSSRSAFRPRFRS